MKINKVKVSRTDKGAEYLSDSVVVGPGLTKSITAIPIVPPPGITTVSNNETLDININIDNSTIEIDSESNSLKLKQDGIDNTHIKSQAGIDASKIADGSVSNENFENISGLSSNAQIQIDEKISSSEKGISNGVATLDAEGKIPAEQLPDSTQSMPSIQRKLVAGEFFTANTSFLVRWAVSGETAGQIYKADKTVTFLSKYMAIGIASSTADTSAGSLIDVVILGEHTLGTNNIIFSTSDVGKELFVGSSGAIILGSELENTVNEAQFCVGVVQTTNKVWIDAKQLRGII